MSKSNIHDLRCAQDVFRLNRDGDEAQEPPRPSRQPHAVARRRNGKITRVTPLPKNTQPLSR